jgi:hypothetical protein
MTLQQIGAALIVLAAAALMWLSLRGQHPGKWFDR